MAFLLVALPSLATADDAGIIAVHDAETGAVVRAVTRAAPGDRAGLQTAYERSRRLAARVQRVAVSTEGCRRMRDGLLRLARLGAAVPDGYDRLDPARARSARAAFARQRSVVAARAPGCRIPSRRGARVSDEPVLIEPMSRAVTNGRIRVAMAPGADTAELWVDGRHTVNLAHDGRVAVGVLSAGIGRHTVTVRFMNRGRHIATGTASGVQVTHTGGRRATTVRTDAPATAALRGAAGRFDGIGAAWISDLASGRRASWNADARFPAASTVKLGVMIEAARRSGAYPDRSAFTDDVVAIGGWSSNLAVNRLLPRIGGSAAVQRRLTTMGASRSTFTGGYMVATDRMPRAGSPPASSRRVTTAADLGRIMTLLHDSARGEAAARRATGLTSRQARFVLGTLYASERTGDNRGILDGLAANLPAAQKHGWVSSSRHTVALVDSSGGPVVVVALTWSPGLTAQRARAFGREVLRIAQVGGG